MSKEVPLKMRYYGVCHLLADVSKALARRRQHPHDVEAAEIQERVRCALDDCAASSENLEVWGNERQGYTLNLDFVPEYAAADMLVEEESAYDEGFRFATQVATSDQYMFVSPTAILDQNPKAPGSDAHAQWSAGAEAGEAPPVTQQENGHPETADLVPPPGVDS